jgi:predicted DsbA family dithiol-disulfide isomerase
MTISIDIVSDVICPWCYLGKRRLDKAISMLEGIETDIRWRPFLLDATIPKTGIPREEYLLKKFGSAERIAELHKPLKAAGDAEGIAYAFDKIKVTPNTLNAHRLLRWVYAAGKQHEMAEKLFALYWLEGQDIGNSDVLLKAAIEVGLDGPLISQLLASPAFPPSSSPTAMPWSEPSRRKRSEAASCERRWSSGAGRTQIYHLLTNLAEI